jgi:anthranilate synthase component 2
MKVLVIDNYDSFVYNLVQYIGEQGAETLVYRNDQITLQEAAKLKPDRIVISPGPGNPEDDHFFGVCKSILQTLSLNIPTLAFAVTKESSMHTAAKWCMQRSSCMAKPALYATAGTAISVV